MSKILKCTHCHKTFATDECKNYTFATKVLTGDYGVRRKYMEKQDLCPECADHFFNWLYENDKD